MLSVDTSNFDLNLIFCPVLRNRVTVMRIQSHIFTKVIRTSISLESEPRLLFTILASYPSDENF
jgi:hypothetical protein